MPAERTTRANGDDTKTLPNAAASRYRASLDAALACQREEWLQGIRTPIADRLRACGALCGDPAQAAELIYHEVLLRRDSGETPDWDSVLRQFPEYAAQLGLFREADEIVESGIPPTNRSATQLGGYDLLEVVGRGGMGVVYRARERNLDRMVAIKRVRGGALADDQVIGRFLKEAKAVSRLNHPNIVQIYCVSDWEGEPFIALEFVEGPTLAERIGGTPLAPRVAATIAAAVARAIGHAHQHGIVHRDLKPANILLAGKSDRPVPKVTDFGAAKQLDQATDSDRTQFLGTPSYMAPEQIEPKWGAIGQLTDVYGVGAVLYEALTGRPPFRADSISETLRQVMETQPVSPQLLNPAVPRDLATVCLKCLQKEPGRRYDSAAALGDDLDRFLGGQPIHARPISSAARAWMWCRRKPGTASLVAVLVLALLGGMAGITLEWRRAEAARKIAVASDVESQELFSQLIQSIRLVPEWSDRLDFYSPGAHGMDSLLKAEVHCKSLLLKNPDEITLRIALTKVYGSLGAVFEQRPEQWTLADDRFRHARLLWEPLASDVAGDPVCRYWLATTSTWQAGENIRLHVQSHLRAEAIWEKLAEEQPGNLDFMHKIRECRLWKAQKMGVQDDRDRCLPLLEESRTEQDRLVRMNPADRAQRRQLAFTCFLLGEGYAYSSADKALSCWRESYEHDNILAEGGHDDLLGNINLAITCSRLIQGQHADPFYLQAVPLLEQSGRRLNALLKQEPESDWLRELLLEDYCCLALCHVKAGQTAKAEQASQDCVSVLTAPLDRERIEPMFALHHAGTLLWVGDLLRQAKQPAAALRLVRQAAALCSQLAVYPSHNPGFLHYLSSCLVHCSVLANQLGESAFALQQAESGRRIVEEWIRTAPADLLPEEALTGAWQRIAKAHWSLGERDQALAAFRESAVIDKRLFERQPSSHFFRACLSKSYDRLVFYGSQAGDVRGAAAAVFERTKLWPDDAKQLTKSADDFDVLAKQVTARARGPLSREDQAERDHDLAESRRVRQAAEAASRRVGHDLRAELSR